MKEDLSWVELDKSAWENNWNFFEGKLGVEIVPVLKSNAYGHGLEPMAKLAKEAGAKRVALFSAREAIKLAKLGLDLEVMLLGPVGEEEVRSLEGEKLKVSYLVYDQNSGRKLEKIGKRLSVQIKIDTGMNRLGFKQNEWAKTAQWLAESQLEIKGIMSHLHSAGGQREATRQQLKQFKEAVKIFEDEGIKFEDKHIMATSGSWIEARKEGFNLARLGIGLYGYWPLKGELGEEYLWGRYLEPVLSLKSRVVETKKVEKGEVIGYGGSFEAEEKLRIGVVPLGYDDGVRRCLSNWGQVRIKESKCPVVGRVSMNMITVRIGEKVKVGDEVLVMGGSKGEGRWGIEKIAQKAGTISYEILTGINNQLERRVVDVEAGVSQKQEGERKRN